MTQTQESRNPAGGRGSGGGFVREGLAETAYTMPAQWQFLEAMRAAGVMPADPAEIVGDGAMHRFKLEGDRQGTRNGWAVLHLDGIPSGAFGSWKAGTSSTWCAVSRDRLTPAERDEHRRRIEAARQAARAMVEQKHRDAAAKAAAMWNRAKPAPEDHPYLIRKAVKPFHARALGDALMLPIVTFSGTLAGLQFIAQDGSKRMLSGTAKAGNFIPVSHGATDARVILCEGFATGATIAAADPAAVVLACIDAGNLQPVATEARRRWPAADLVIACDNDRTRDDNKGLTMGRAAAIAASARIMVPEFPEDAPASLSDFNDLANWQAGRGHDGT